MIDSVSLAGQRVLVTGGTTGIGRATVHRLVGAGAQVLTFGRDRDALGQAIADAPEGPGSVTGLTADIATQDGVDQVFAAVDAELGGIDILVCNAALGADPIHEMDDADWRYVVDTNLVGYLACARAAIDRMRERGGQLLFVSSISVAIKARGESVYAATKGGVNAFAETLRKEVAELGIRVGIIEPGSVATDMQECSTDEQRAAVSRREMLHADAIADAILFALTRDPGCDVVSLRIEPQLQKGT